MARTLVDTNVLVYAFLDDERSARARLAMGEADVISVQALNEFASVAHRKLGKGWADIRRALNDIRDTIPDIRPIEATTHAIGIDVAERYRLGFYDAVMIAVALQAHCSRVLSEDMQDGMVIEGRLRIENPFR